MLIVIWGSACLLHFDGANNFISNSARCVTVNNRVEPHYYVAITNKLLNLVSLVLMAQFLQLYS